MASTDRIVPEIVRGSTADERQLIEQIVVEHGSDCSVSVRRYRDPLFRKRVEIQVFPKAEIVDDLPLEAPSGDQNEPAFNGVLEQIMSEHPVAPECPAVPERVHTVNALQDRHRQLTDDLQRTLRQAEIDVQQAEVTATEIVATARKDVAELRATSVVATDEKIAAANRQATAIVAAAERDRDAAHQRLTDATRRYDELVREGHAAAERVTSDSQLRASRVIQEQHDLLEAAKKTADQAVNDATAHASSLVDTARAERSDVLAQATSDAETLMVSARSAAQTVIEEAKREAQSVRTVVEREDQDARFVRENLLRDAHNDALKVRQAANGYRIKVTMDAKRESLAMQERTAKLFHGLLDLAEQTGNHIDQLQREAAEKAAVMIREAEAQATDAASTSRQLVADGVERANLAAQTIEGEASELAAQIIADAKEEAAKIKRHARKVADQRARRMERAVRRQFREEIEIAAN